MEGAIPAMELPISAMEGAIPATKEAIPAMEGAIPEKEGAIPAMKLATPAMEGAIPAMELPILAIISKTQDKSGTTYYKDGHLKAALLIDCRCTQRAQPGGIPQTPQKTGG